MNVKIIVGLLIGVAQLVAWESSRGAGRASVDHVGVLASSYAKVIKPSDFNAGPVVITQPGYYVLSASVTFGPQCPSNLDSLGNSWNAAIIILANDVTLDLNSQSIAQNLSEGASSHFKIIQLGGINPLTLDSSLQWYTPHNVVIKNGTIGQSNGFGIYGQNNTRVTCLDLSIIGCAKAAIYLENLSYSYLKNISIVGSENTTGIGYGIFLRDNSYTEPYWTSARQGTHGPISVVMENISVADITTNSTMNIQDEAMLYMQELYGYLQFAALSSALDADGVSSDVYDAGLVALEDLQALKSALLTYMNSLYVGDKNIVISLCSDILADLANLQVVYDLDIENNGLFAVNSSVNRLAQQYEFLVVAIMQYADAMWNVIQIGYVDILGEELGYLYEAWPAYGIRVVQGKSITIKNCAISGVQLAEDVTGDTVASGVYFAACQGVTSENVLVQGSYTPYGFANGIMSDGLSSGMYFMHCDVTNCTSNDAVFPYFVCQSKAHRFEDCNAVACNAKSVVIGFYSLLSSGNSFNRCSSYSHSCALQEALDYSLVAGFISESGTGTTFKECKAYDLMGDTNYINSSYVSNMKVIGLGLLHYTGADISDLTYWDRASLIDHCTVYENDGCGGSAIGIYLDGAAGSTVTNNTVSMQLAREFVDGQFYVLGNGYGIYDTASDTSALIVKNLSYANQTRNYKVSFSLPNETLPVAQSTYGDMTGVYMANEWDNISLQPNPGAAGCVDACTDLQEFF